MHHSYDNTIQYNQICRFVVAIHDKWINYIDIKVGFFRSGLKYIRLLLTDVNHRNLKWKNLSKMAINHSGFFKKYWTNHHVILRYVNLNMINYRLGHHMTSPHHTRWKKRRSISQFCSLVAKRIWMICCQFSISFFTAGKKTRSLSFF